MRIKTIVPKNAGIEQYVGKPVYDNMNPTSGELKLIGHVEDVRELEYNYELTMKLNSILQIEWSKEKRNQVEKINIRRIEIDSSGMRENDV